MKDILRFIVVIIICSSIVFLSSNTFKPDLNISLERVNDGKVKITINTNSEKTTVKDLEVTHNSKSVSSNTHTMTYSGQLVVTIANVKPGDNLTIKGLINSDINYSKCFIAFFHKTTSHYLNFLDCITNASTPCVLASR